MKRFDFKLEKVLGHRGVREAQKKRLFAEAQRAIATQREQIRIIEGEIHKQMAELRTRCVENVDVRDVVARRLYTSYLQSAAALANETLASLRGQLEVRRKELVQASKEKKVLERVREKRFREHVYEMDREEQRFIDELGVFRR